MKILRVLGRTLIGLERIILVCLILVGLSIWAVANYNVTQGSGTVFGSVVISTVHYAAQLICDATNGTANCAAVKAGNTAAVGDQALEVSDANVLNAINQPTTVFAATPTASVTRPANTTTYTANTGWCNLTAACATVFTFTSACRVNGEAVLIPEIDIWSSANQSTKLQGVLYLFSAAIGTVINDNATFTIAAADFANLTGNQQGFAFTLGNSQASGAANSGISLTGTTYHAQCFAGSTQIVGMVQVVNAYVPVSAEVLHVTLHTVGLN